MKKIIFACLAMVSIFHAYAQSDENGRETRTVSAFHGVEVSGGVDLYISMGTQSVAVSAANAEIRKHMVTEVVGGILRVHLEDNWQPGLSNPKMKVFVSASELSELGASGGGNIYIQHGLTTGNLNVSLSGGSDLEGKLNSDRLDITQSGGSEVNLTGNVKTLNVQASGGGKLRGYDLVADNASIMASGGSNSELTVNKELRAVTSGGSDIIYKGTAKVMEIRSSGGGSITHKD
jgi:hypothetical protein